MAGRNQHQPVHELLEAAADQGFCRLPEPSPGDIFFDLEGDPFVGTGGRRIWARIQHLGQPEKPKAKRKARVGAQAAKGAPAKAKANKKATPAKKAPKPPKKARVRKAESAREGSKTAQVVAMLQRKGGATLAEITAKMGWQKHTVRGFMAGAMKKAGYAVESFKPEGGERTYRINK